MPPEIPGSNYQWLRSAQEAFPAMLAAIEAARQSICLESYIFAAGGVGDQFRDALVRARQQGTQVRVLVDGLGSYGLPAHFWQPLLSAGGEVKIFNPVALNRLGIRNHRKLLVCDDQVAFVGGFNIAPQYEGDGVTKGWCDLGVRLEGPLAAQLADTFDEMFSRAEFRHKYFARLRRSAARRTVESSREHILLSGPGRGRNPIKGALRRDLAGAQDVQIIVAYFLPTWRLRRQLARIARHGCRVRLILAGKSDVTVSRLAGQSLYRRFLKAGVEIFEYRPQILHAKLIIIDDVVYVGSCNLDQRSLNINYELMIRFESPEMAAQARSVFATTLERSRQVTREGWRRSRSLWRRLKQHWAYFLLVRVDPYIAKAQWRALPD